MTATRLWFVRIPMLNRIRLTTAITSVEMTIVLGRNLTYLVLVGLSPSRMWRMQPIRWTNPVPGPATRAVPTSHPKAHLTLVPRMPMHTFRLTRRLPEDLPHMRRLRKRTVPPPDTGEDRHHRPTTLSSTPPPHRFEAGDALHRYHLLCHTRHPITLACRPPRHPAAGYAQSYAGHPGQSVSEPSFAAKTTQFPFPSVRGPESYPQHSAAGYTGGSRSVKADPGSRPLSHDQAPSYQNASRPSYDSHSDGGPGGTRRGVGSSTPSSSSYHSPGLDDRQAIGENSRMGQQKNERYHGQSHSSDARSQGDPELGTASSRKNIDMPEHTGSSRVMGECLAMVDG